MTISIYQKIRELTFANTEERFKKLLTLYRDDIFNNVNKIEKNADFYNFSYIDEIFAKHYLEERFKQAEGDELDLLNQILLEKNIEQEYGDFAHIDDNEHIFTIENNKKLNFASTSDMSMAFRYSYVATVINQTFLTSDKKTVNVLDIGCSKGTFFHFWRNLYQPAKKPTISYTGLDIRQEVIDYCNKTFKDVKNGQFLLCNIMEDELPAEKYDCILLMEIIEHIPVADGKKILEKCYELLADDGILVVSSPNPKKHIGQMLTNPEAHIFEYSLDEMKELLAEHKFQISDLSGWFGRGRYLTAGLSEEEKVLYDKVTRLGPGLRMAFFSFIRPDLAECYTMICSKVEGEVNHNIETFSKVKIKSKKD
jgi:2-polyprenyl-3-methyl-5-hydroxy-6-metoxy-1,4-benzoquinol methylase